MKSRFYLRGLHPIIYLHINQFRKERQQLADALLKSPVITYSKIVKRVKIQLPYLYYDAMVIYVCIITLYTNQRPITTELVLAMLDTGFLLNKTDELAEPAQHKSRDMAAW